MIRNRFGSSDFAQASVLVNPTLSSFELPIHVRELPHCTRGYNGTTQLQVLQPWSRGQGLRVHGAGYEGGSSHHYRENDPPGFPQRKYLIQDHKTSNSTIARAPKKSRRFARQRVQQPQKWKQHSTLWRWHGRTSQRGVLRDESRPNQAQGRYRVKWKSD